MMRARGRCSVRDRITSSKAARLEAAARLREQHGLNTEPGLVECAYSPSTFAVGMRWVFDGEPYGPFRVFNIHYPMYGHNDEVRDWVSVGVARAKVCK